MKKTNIIIVVIILAALPLFSLKHAKHLAHVHQHGEMGKENPEIDYWTCSMHPQVKSDKPGKCPICGMELIPVYPQDAGKIVVEKNVRQRLGIKSEPVKVRDLTKLIRLPGRVSHDYEFYSLQQEYLSVRATGAHLDRSVNSEFKDRQDALLQATKLRLNLLGISDDEIKILEQNGKPDGSLIYPEQGKAWILADIYQQDIQDIKPGQSVNVKIKGYPDEFKARVYSVEKVLNPQTRSALARIVVEDPQNILKHEVFADLMVQAPLGDRLCVSDDGVIDTGTRKIVYVDFGEGRYQPVQVKTGIEAQGYVEILEGLKAGDMVVSEGNFLLDSQTTLTGGQSLLYGAGEEIDPPSQE